MKKMLFIIMILFLVSGCGIKYKLNIKDNSIEENIEFSLEKTGNIVDDDLEIPYDSDNYIDFLIDSEIHSTSNSTLNDKSYYQKEIKQNGNIYNFNLSYEFKNNEYIKSRVINECFENHVVNIKDKKVYIHLSGEFYCYQDKPIDITITSDNIIKKANGQKSGNSYSWTIDSTNYNNVDIEIETTNESVARYYIYVGIAIVLVIGLVLFVINFFGNIMGRNSINKI